MTPIRDAIGTACLVLVATAFLLALGFLIAYPPGPAEYRYTAPPVLAYGDEHHPHPDCTEDEVRVDLPGPMTGCQHWVEEGFRVLP